MQKFTFNEKTLRRFKHQVAQRLQSKVGQPRHNLRFEKMDFHKNVDQESRRWLCSCGHILMFGWKHGKYPKIRWVSASRFGSEVEAPRIIPPNHTPWILSFVTYLAFETCVFTATSNSKRATSITAAPIAPAPPAPSLFLLILLLLLLLSSSWPSSLLLTLAYAHPPRPPPPLHST